MNAIRTIALFGMAAGMCMAAGGAARAQQGFSGAFAPGNWTVTDTAGGLVDASQAPSAITLIDGANQVGGSTLYTITVPYDVTLTFNWNYLNNDLYQEPLFEPAGYVAGGIPTQLTDDFGAILQNGTVTVDLTAGEIFGFEVSTFDGYYGGYNGDYGSAFLTLDSFAVPEPASLAMMGVGLAALCFGVRRRSACAA